MGDPTGYLDEGKGLPWITMDYYWYLKTNQPSVSHNKSYYFHPLKEKGPLITLHPA